MPKTKISLTIEQTLVRDCDRLARGTSRSEVFEKAVAAWLRERRRLRLGEEIERYYSSLSDSEREEDSRWADLSSRALGETWR